MARIREAGRSTGYSQSKPVSDSSSLGWLTALRTAGAIESALFGWGKSSAH